MPHPRRLVRPALIAALLGAIPLIGPVGAGAGPAPDPAADQAAQRDPAVGFLAQERGISRDEAAARQARQTEALEAIERNQLEERKDFGGVWIDGDDQVTVGVVDGASVRSLGLSDLAGGATVEGREVRASFAALKAIAANVSDGIHELPALDRAQVEVGIDTPRNRVVIRTADQRSAAVAALVERAASVHGSLLAVEGGLQPVEPSSCTSGPYCGPPLRGGVQIDQPTSYCSGGFYARSVSDNKPYLITAGHCSAGPWTTKASAGTTHVIGDRHSSHVGIYGDFGIIDIDNPLGWQPKPWVVVLASSSTTLDEEYAISNEGGSVVGMSVCKTGATTGTTCGFVQQVGITATYTSGETVSNLGRADYCSAPGDSGGPVYRLHNAYGIHVASSGSCTTYYSSIGAAESISNVEVVNGP